MFCYEQLQQQGHVPIIHSNRTLHVHMWLDFFIIDLRICQYNLHFIIREAATQSEFCNLTILWDENNWGEKPKVCEFYVLYYNLIMIFKRNETQQKHWYEICTKSPHPNSILCPNTTEFHPANVQAEIDTKKLRWMSKM